jgi:hypothetical protein
MAISALWYNGSMANTVFLGLQTCNLGARIREVTNPFTGEKLHGHIDNPVSQEERAAGEQILNSANATAPDPDGFRTVILDGNRTMAIAFSAMGGEIHIEGGLRLDAIELVFRLATASEMLVTSSIDPATIAVPPGQRNAGIRERWPTAVYVDSAALLFDWVLSEIRTGHICG